MKNTKIQFNVMIELTHLKKEGKKRKEVQQKLKEKSYKILHVNNDVFGAVIQIYTLTY